MTELFASMYRDYLDVEFMENAHNVYRTNEFIVKQVIKAGYGSDTDNGIMSFDTYYVRTPERDALYEEIFWAKGSRIDGKRMPSTMYSRTYVD